MNREPRTKLARRVITAAETALARDRYVSPIAVWTGLGWLSGHVVDEWRQGRTAHLSEAIAVAEDKLAETVRELTWWAGQLGLCPAEIGYLAATLDHRPLRFTANGQDKLERACRTHWISPELSERRRAELVNRQSQPPDLVAVVPLGAWRCAGCADSAEIMIMDDGEPLCLSCADLDHLVFLPAGDAALTRRAKKASGRSVVVVRFNRPRKRYERQGVLVEAAALELAEQECLADADLRESRRERDRDRRAAGDVVFQGRFAAEIRRLYPGCPQPRAEAIARHAGARGSGRVGRSAGGRALVEQLVRLAVAASVRHEDTDYDALLDAGVPRREARDRVRAGIDRVLESWCTP